MDQSRLNSAEIRVMVPAAVKAAVDFEADSKGISTSALVRDWVVRELEQKHNE